MKVKVCGMKCPGNMMETASLGIDYMGFIFYPPSPRYCGDTLDKATLDSLPDRVVPVAVTVDMGEDEIFDIARHYGFNTFQLHGDETPEMCERLRDGGLKVIKASGIRDMSDLEKLDPYSGKVDWFLFDTATDKRGGSGQKFDWGLLAGYSLPEKFFLSGGIDSKSVGEIVSLRHDAFMGIDLNSRFELEPGVKDVEMLRGFLKKLKKI